jgi:hypothetical protein
MVSDRAAIPAIERCRMAGCSSIGRSRNHKIRALINRRHEIVRDARFVNPSCDRAMIRFAGIEPIAHMAKAMPAMLAFQLGLAEISGTKGRWPQARSCCAHPRLYLAEVAQTECA